MPYTRAHYDNNNICVRRATAAARHLTLKILYYRYICLSYLPKDTYRFAINRFRFFDGAPFYLVTRVTLRR